MHRDIVATLATVERALAGTPYPSSGQPTTSTPPAAPTASPDFPTSFANGRYEVKRFLGEGGKKKVYLAQAGISLKRGAG